MEGMDSKECRAHEDADETDCQGAEPRVDDGKECVPEMGYVDNTECTDNMETVDDPERMDGIEHVNGLALNWPEQDRCSS